MLVEHQRQAPQSLRVWGKVGQLASSGFRIPLKFSKMKRGLHTAPMRTWFIALHRLLVPLLLFAFFFDLSIINPTEINWLLIADLGQHFIGWTAFRFDEWRWPIGFTQLTAYPHGMPLLATDSNPLVSLPLKALSPLLPQRFQFVGLWYFVCITLSYNIVFNLLIFLNGQPVPASVAGAILIVAAPFFFQRFYHDTLMAHWLIFAELSTFIRPHSDRAALTRHSGVASLAVLVHPYFLVMILPIAGMDVVRKAYGRHKAYATASAIIGFLAASVAAIILPPLILGIVTGAFSLETRPNPIGHFSMDPLAWFNSQGLSAFLRGWEVGRGQHEGFQYLGLGGLAAVASALVLWASRMAEPPKALQYRLPWLLPAITLLLVFAISPVVTVFGHQVFAVDVSEYPIAGPLFSVFRSSGRMAWPASYLILIVAVASLLSFPSRLVGALLICLTTLQILDQVPLAELTKSATAPKETSFRVLRSSKSWERLVKAADRIYIGGPIKRRALFELGLLAFPRQKSFNRFSFAQNLTTRSQATAQREAHGRVREGQLSSKLLYILDTRMLRHWFKLGLPAIADVRVLNGMAFIPPSPIADRGIGEKLFMPGAVEKSLYHLVNGCRKDCAVILSVRDEGRRNLSKDLIALLNRQGGNIDRLAYRGSYAAIIVNGWVVKEAFSHQGDVSVRASVFGFDIQASSEGLNGSGESSIRVKGFEVSPNTCGVNTIRVEPEGISAIATFDTQCKSEP